MFRSGFIFVLVLLWSSYAFATHIVGGSISLVYVSGNNYKLQMKVLRDCINGNPNATFDRPATIGMFNKRTNQRVQNFSLNSVQVTQLQSSGPNCAPAPNACTELGFYELNVTFNPTVYNSTDGYYFVYMRCCRNGIIENIVQPGDAAIALYCEVPAFSLRNSSPTFSNNPFTYMCTNNDFNYNFNFTDVDGDVLVYSLVTPLNGTLDKNTPITNNPDPGPYSGIQWLPTYSETNQLTGNPGLEINRDNGNILMNPNRAGVYVAAFKVEEFRFGTKIGEVRLELQFNVSACLTNVTPVLLYKGLQGEFISTIQNVEVNQKICLDVDVSDPQDSLYVKVSSSALKDSTLSIKPEITDTVKAGSKNVVTRVCWQTNCALAGKSATFTVEATDNGCPMPRKVKGTFIINVTPMPVVSPIDILCFHLKNNEIEFDYGDTSSTNPYFKQHYVYRAINDGPFQLIDSVSDINQRTYRDANAPDNRNINYKYFMRAANLCDVTGNTSDTSTTFDNLEEIPRAQPLITVSVEENKKLKVIWPANKDQDFARYRLYKTTRTNTSSWIELADLFKATDTVFVDEDVDVQQESYCYYIVTRDTCQNESNTGPFSCSIVLKGNSNPFTHKLEWMPYSYWLNGTRQYDVLRSDHLTDNNIIALGSPALLKYTDDNLNTKSGIFKYTIVAHEEHTTGSGQAGTFYDAESRSNTIELIQAPLLYVPNAFTPNNDGSNDEVGIRDVFVKDYELRIYNRWGQLVFRTLDKNVQWKGVDEEGVKQPDDAYIYIIHYTGWDGSAYTKQGNLTLLR
ncbi:MAG: gliding motility-associated C-terminal domain-containing protein [Bacteroidota bacterium]